MSDVYKFIKAQEASTLVQEQNSEFSRRPWLESIAHFVNTSGMELVSVGYDSDGAPETLVLRGDPSKGSSSLKW